MRTTIMVSPTRRLPTAHTLTPTYLASLVMALLMAGVSSIGLLYQRAIYPTEAARLAFVPSDGFMLVVSLPLLLGAIWLAWRGSLIGLLCWPGALFVVLYVYLPYVISAPFSVLFLPHLALVALSAATLIGLVASIDGAAVRARLAGHAPARAGGSILVGLAIFIIVRPSAVIAAALASQVSVDPVERASWIADFVVAVPLLLVGGVQLWRRTALGYATGAGLLLGYGVLALSVIPFFVAQARAAAAPLDWIGVWVILGMAVLCFIPFAFYMRGAGSEKGRIPG